MSQAARGRATQGDFLAIPEDVRFHELVDGQLVEKAPPGADHGDAQAGLVVALRPPFQRKPGSGGPGGWWILTEVEVSLDTGDIMRPDVVGWRRDRSPGRPKGSPVKLRPDFVCEVISEHNAKQDTVKKLRLYHRVLVPHYWIVDPRDETLTALRWSEAGYLNVLSAERGEVVRVEPFEAVELVVGTLFGDDPSD